MTDNAMYLIRERDIGVIKNECLHFESSDQCPDNCPCLIQLEGDYRECEFDVERYIRSRQLPAPDTIDASKWSHEETMNRLQCAYDRGEREGRGRILERLHPIFESIKKHWGEHHEAPVYQRNKLVKCLDDFEESLRGEQ